MSSSLRLRTILHIDDDMAVQSVIDSIMNLRPGVFVICAARGARGVEMAREDKPDLILLDLNLPDGPGENVLRELKADPSIAHIPVIVVTGDPSEERLDQLRAAGAAAVIHKPFAVDRFLEVFDRVLW